jgi:hypothetical protein
VHGTLRATLLALFFLGSGLLTFQIYSWIAKTGPDEYQLVLQLLTGVPFGAACTLRFVRPGKWALPVLLLDCLTWVAAYRLALSLSGLNAFAVTALAGAAGAVGVTASTGIGCRVLYSKRTLATAALIGAIAGWPFGLILDRSAQQDMILALAFPLWQVAVGLWIGKSAAVG